MNGIACRFFFLVRAFICQRRELLGERARKSVLLLLLLLSAFHNSVVVIDQVDRDLLP